MRRAIVIIPFILLLISIGYVVYKIQKPDKLNKDLFPAYKLEAVSLFKQFQLIEMTANSKYKNQLIEVMGNVKEVKTDIDGNVTVVLEAENPVFAVNCALDKSEIPFANQIQKGEELILQGICTGIFLDVQLVDCTIK
jgi:tRNA_anti-like